jgi:PAS domain S-box-containing protein
MLVIITLSILFQLAATVLALKLIAITRRMKAWVFLASAIALMTARRVESLVHFLSGSATGPDDLLFEVIGLVLSAFMFAGVYHIRPLFLEIVQSGEKHRQMNERLKALSEEQTLLLKHTGDFIYRHDLQGIISYVSPAVEKITGYSPAEWCTHYTTHYTPNSINRAGIDATDEMVRTGMPGAPYRIEVKHKKRGSVWLEINKQPYQQDGKMSGLIGVARDVTGPVALEQEREKLIADLQAALASIKTLKGLLPICSSCKKVRDDQGYWQQIEFYVSARSEAEFSHGICPDCAKHLYPGLIDKT